MSLEQGLVLLSFTLLGGFLWRIRGGLLNNITGQANWLGVFNDTTVRLIFGYGLALAWWGWHGVPWYGALALGLALFIGETWVGWLGASLTPTLPDWTSVTLLSGSTLLRLLPAAVAVGLPVVWAGSQSGLGGIELLECGAVGGLWYWLGARLPSPWPWLFWGEWLFGASLGFTLFFVGWGW